MPILGGLRTGPGEDDAKVREDVRTRKSVQHLIEGLTFMRGLFK
jgi:hypothetical protein